MADAAALDLTTSPLAGTPPAAVDLKGVTKRYGSVTALSSIDLTINKGEFFSLLGPSGCGKSTTLALIGGFEAPSEGVVRIAGDDVSAVPSYRRPVNTVFQSYALFPHMSVAQNVAFGLKMKGIGAAERREKVRAVLNLVALDEHGDRRPSQLSGGQRQRVALARALVNEPAVLLLDEPLGALDLKLRKQMQSELTSLQRKVGITFVYVTHDQDEALTMSDRIAVMDHGKILQIGTPEEIYDTPAHRFVMEFMGTPNVLPGRLGDDAIRAEIDGIGPMPCRSEGAVRAGDTVALMIRPERVRLSRERPEGAAFAATVDRVVKVGFVAHYHLRHASGREVLAYRLNEDAAEAAPLTSGQEVHVTWSPNDAVSFAA